MYAHNDIIIKNVAKKSHIFRSEKCNDDSRSVIDLINTLINYIFNEKTNIYHLILVFITNDVFTASIIINMIIERELEHEHAASIIERMQSEAERVRPIMFTLLMSLKMKQTQSRTVPYYHVYSNIYKFVIRNMMP